jgi:hypothetical protein
MRNAAALRDWPRMPRPLPRAGSIAPAQAFRCFPAVALISEDASA